MEEYEKIELLIGGDVAPRVDIEMNAAIEAGTIFGKSMSPVLADVDLVAVNLECPLTLSEEKRQKIGLNLRGVPESAALLRASGIKLVSLANNHIFDYDVVGVQDTIRHLEHSEIRWGGVGDTPENADRLTVIECKGRRIGFLFYAEHEFNYRDDFSWSTALQDGAANVLKIQEAKPQCDFLIVFCHFGPEHWSYPSPAMVRLFRNYARAGASVVVNCHAHRTMGMEYYGRTPIYYGMGNLFFPARPVQPDHWYQGMMIRLTLTADTVRGTPVFTEFKRTGMVELVPAPQSLQQEFERVSEVLSDPRNVSEKWREFCRKQQSHLRRQMLKGAAAMLPGLLFRYLGIAGKSGKSATLFRKGARLFRGLLTCENHLLVLGQIFDDLQQSARRNK